MLIEPIVEEDAEDGGWDGGQKDVGPFGPDHLLLVLGFVLAKRPEVDEEMEDDRQDGGKLDDDQKELEEILALGFFEREKFLEDEHMPGGGYREPFGDAFDYAEDDGFDDIDYEVHLICRGARYVPLSGSLLQTLAS